jgi:hypothetical protein
MSHRSADPSPETQDNPPKEPKLSNGSEELHAILTSRTAFTALAVLIVVSVVFSILVTRYGGGHGPGIYLAFLIGAGFLARHIVGTAKLHNP